MRKFVRMGAAAAVLAAAMAMPVYAETLLPDGLSAAGTSLAGMTREEAEQAIEAYVEALGERKVTLDIGDDRADTTAGELGLAWSNQEAVEEALDEYQGGNLVARFMKASDLKQEPRDIAVETSVDQAAVEAFIESRFDGMVEAPVNAAVTRTDGEFVVTPSAPGMSVDLEATNAALNEAFLAGGDSAIEVEAVITEKEADITTEDLETIGDLLGTFSTNFNSGNADRATNLQVGSGKINGRVLMPGETLSGYECLQPFTVENGYRNADTYVNGQVVDSIGGGVCQISTTLYNAALRAELEITQRQNHSMIVTYVEPSMDAAIAGTVKDLKITNNYSTPIYVEGYTDGGTLTFSIYGKETRPANREIKFVSETLRRTSPGNPQEIADASLAPGSRVQVQSAHYGIESRLWKYVYEDGEEVEKTLLNEDVYYPSKAVYRVGPSVSAVAPALPAETVPAETQPEETDPETEEETQPEETLPAETSPDVYGPGIGLETKPADEESADTEPQAEAAQTEAAAAAEATADTGEAAAEPEEDPAAAKAPAPSEGPVADAASEEPEMPAPAPETEEVPVPAVVSETIPPASVGEPAA